MPTPPILVETDGPVRTIIINRPDKRNAVDRPTADALGGAGFDLRDTRVLDHPNLPGLIQEFLEGTAKPR